MKEFWDERYSEHEYVYGEEPNAFFREQLSRLQTGSILLPADGEGRNGVFAAEQGWTVTSFDYSTSGKIKAEALALKKGVHLEYLVGDFEQMDFPVGSFDAIALIFAHFLPGQREAYHRKVIDWLKPGGAVIIEAFTADQLECQKNNPRAGGPKHPSLLYSADILEQDFGALRLQCIEEALTTLHEGNYHVGQSAVVRMVAIKPF